METTEQPVRTNRIYGIVGALAGMLLTFIAGIWVGMHPDWIPNMPWAYNPANDQTPNTTLHVPSSQPTTDPSADNR